MHLLEMILNAFIQFGYVIVFIGVLLDNMGLPVPGETNLLAAGLFAARGDFHVLAVMGLGALGAICGDNVGFWLGYKLGRPALDKHGRFLWLTPRGLKTLERFFARYGDVTLVFARFVSVLRVTVALFAGISLMPWRRFLLGNAVGGVLWAMVISLLGWLCGESWELLHRWLGWGSRLVLGGLAVAGLSLVARRYGRYVRRAPQRARLRQRSENPSGTVLQGSDSE
jgi:membrane protein DedA with SNARE-associated domain